jgi:hypothetical protein
MVVVLSTVYNRRENQISLGWPSIHDPRMWDGQENVLRGGHEEPENGESLRSDRKSPGCDSSWQRSSLDTDALPLLMSVEGTMEE